MGENPYESLPEEKFWKLAVAQRGRGTVGGLWAPKFEIATDERVSTYGSCFAQHIGRALASRGYAWTSFETAPAGTSAALKSKYNYDIFSSRTGNIYTASLLRQWAEWATGRKASPLEVWEEGGRFFDPFRPAIEPEGFDTVDELLNSRNYTVKCFADSVRDAQLFVFTLGLTESWFNIAEGYEYPMCPGTLHGVYDPAMHMFRNQTFDEVRAALVEAIFLLRTMNPALKVLLTISPVPLTATNSDDHVLVATTNSKSILRAVAGQVACELADVDYFPSYEIITNPFFEDDHFEANRRNVRATGVRFVMENFFADLARRSAAKPAVGGGEAQMPNAADDTERASALYCEEEFLATFAPNRG